MADAGERMFLTYEHKTNGRKLVPNGVSIMAEEDIVMAISEHPDIYLVIKPINPGQTHIDLYKIDLLPESEKQLLVKDPAADKKEEVPWKVFLGYEWEGHSFDELAILTPDPTSAHALKGDVNEAFKPAVAAKGEGEGGNAKKSEGKGGMGEANADEQMQ